MVLIYFDKLILIDVVESNSSLVTAKTVLSGFLILELHADPTAT